MYNYFLPHSGFCFLFDIYKNIFTRNFEKLLIWKISHALTLKIYAVTKSFPSDELFGLVSQMRRSSASIPTNVAEGCGRTSNAELKRFLMIAAGSSSELQYQLLLCKDLNYIPQSIYAELNDTLVQLRKMIYSYSEKLNSWQLIADSWQLSTPSSTPTPAYSHNSHSSM